MPQTENKTLWLPSQIGGRKVEASSIARTPKTTKSACRLEPAAWQALPLSVYVPERTQDAVLERILCTERREQTRQNRQEHEARIPERCGVEGELGARRCCSPLFNEVFR